MKEYKDKCDKCGRFDYLKGVNNNQCLCNKCMQNMMYQMSIFDMLKPQKNENKDVVQVFYKNNCGKL